MNLRPHHVGISVSDMQRSLDWYKTHFGFQVRSSTHIPEADLRIAYITNGFFEIELFERKGSFRIPGRDTNVSDSFTAQGYKHFAFQVDDVDLTWQKLKAKELDLVSEPTTNTDLGVRYCFIRDPDGILIEFLTLVDTSSI
jgi:catechol 2,3-dioxygenase-like lactoylglutathione lyase family enzyme